MFLRYKEHIIFWNITFSKVIAGTECILFFKYFYNGLNSLDIMGTSLDICLWIEYWRCRWYHTWQPSRKSYFFVEEWSRECEWHFTTVRLWTESSWGNLKRQSMRNVLIVSQIKIFMGSWIPWKEYIKLVIVEKTEV